MKFEDAVLYMKSVGLAAVMPDGKLHPISKTIRKPRGLVPVIVMKNGDLPKDIRETHRRARAEARISRRKKAHA